MALPTRLLNMTLSVSATDSNQTAATVLLMLANIALTERPLTGWEGRNVYPIAGAGNRVITPATVVDGMEFLVVPDYDAGEAFATQEFHVALVRGGVTHNVFGRSFATFSLDGTETSITLHNDGASTNNFTVVNFGRTA